MVAISQLSNYISPNEWFLISTALGKYPKWQSKRCQISAERWPHPLTHIVVDYRTLNRFYSIEAPHILVDSGYAQIDKKKIKYNRCSTLSSQHNCHCSQRTHAAADLPSNAYVFKMTIPLPVLCVAQRCRASVLLILKLSVVLYVRTVRRNLGQLYFVRNQV